MGVGGELLIFTDILTEYEHGPAVLVGEVVESSPLEPAGRLWALSSHQEEGRTSWPVELSAGPVPLTPPSGHQG